MAYRHYSSDYIGAEQAEPSSSVTKLREVNPRPRSTPPRAKIPIQVRAWREAAARELPPSRGFLRTSGLIGEKVTKILLGPGSLHGHQLHFPIALPEAIALNVWKLGLAFVSRQYRTKSSELTSINMTSHPLLCQFAISFAWR
jgi:hypothetical protein